MADKIQPEFRSPPTQSTYTPMPFFFYGTLTGPSTLQGLLRLPNSPGLRPARVRGYKFMLWGQYPFLVRGSPGNSVEGTVYIVETEEHLQKLIHYETDFYAVKRVRIEVEEKQVGGKVFVWAGDDKIDLEEGTWSLSEWKRELAEEMASHFLQ